MIDISVKLQMLEERFKSSAEKAYITSLDNALTIILGKLAKIDSVDEVKRLNALKALIEKEISGLYEDIKPYVKDDMEGFAQFDYKTQFNYLNETASLGYTFASIPKDTMKQILSFDDIMVLNGKGYTLNELFNNAGNGQVEKYKQIISGGLAANDGYSNIAKSLKEAGAEATLNMRTLVQTAVGEARDRANIYTYDDVFADVIIGWKSVAVLDSRTSFQCAALDGVKYMKPKYSYSTIPNRPKRHFNCRSILRPITTFDTVTERAENGDETGQVKSNVKFQDWFSTQSAQFQKEYLGDARYKLYKEERLSIKSFVDVKDGRRFTIKELNEKFDNKIINVPSISFGYGGKFDGYVKDIRPEAKMIIDKLPKPYEIKDKGVKKGSYYQPNRKIIDGKTGSLISRIEHGQRTFIHEYGHHLDYNISKNSGNGVFVVQRSMDKDFVEARRLDIEHLKDLYKDKNLFKELSEKWKKREEFNGASDIFDSLTGGKFYRDYGMHGHGVKYYKSTENKMAETFAQLFEGYANGGKTWDNIVEHYPNQSKLFEQIINEAIK